MRMDKNGWVAIVIIAVMFGLGAALGHLMTGPAVSLEYGGTAVVKVTLIGGLPSLVIPAEVNGLFLVCAANKDAVPRRAPACLTVEQLRAWAPR